MAKKNDDWDLGDFEDDTIEQEDKEIAEFINGTEGEQQAELVMYANEIKKEQLKKVEKEFGTHFNFIDNSGKESSFRSGDNSFVEFKDIYRLEHFIFSLQSIIAAKNDINRNIRFARDYRNSDYSNSIFNRLPLGSGFKKENNYLSGAADIAVSTLLESVCKVKVKPLTIDGFGSVGRTLSVDSNLDMNDSDDGDIDTISRVELIQGATDSFMLKNDFKNVRKGIIEDGLSAGVGFTLLTKGDFTPVGNDFNSNKNEIEIRPINPENIFVDPKATRQDLKDMSYFVISENVPIERLKKHRHWEKIKTFITTKEHKSLNQLNAMVFTKGGFSSINSVRKEELFLGLIYVDYFCSYRLVFSEELQRNVVLFSEWLGTTGVMILTQNKIINIDELPLAVYKPTNEANTLFSKSQIMKSISSQTALNIVDTLLTKRVTAVINKILIATKKTGLNVKDLALLNTQTSGNAVVVDTETVDSMRYLEDKVEEFGEILNMRQSYYRDIDQILGISKMDEGNMGSLQTQGAIQSATNMNSKSNTVALQNLASWTISVARIFGKLMASYYEKRELSLAGVGTEEILTVAEYKPELFVGINLDYVIDGEIYTKEAREIQQQKLKELYMFQGQFGGELITESEFAKMLDLPNKEEVLLRDAQKRGKVSKLKNQVTVEAVNQYSLVWMIINRLYELFGTMTGQTIAPNTPLNALGEGFSAKILPLVIDNFASHEFLRQSVRIDRIGLYSDQEAFAKYLLAMNGIQKSEILQQELAAMDASVQFDQLELGQDVEQNAQQAQADLGQPAGQNAPQQK